MYKRIVLKLSGESLGKDGKSIDSGSVEKIVSEIIPVYKKGISIGIVIGGGNIWRGNVDGVKIDKTAADYIGMTATLVNGMVLCEHFKISGISAKVFSPFNVSNFLEQFSLEKIESAWQNKNIVIMAGGTGRPHFTTDTASVIFAIESKAEAIFKATNVDGVYDDDPRKNPKAKLFKKISFNEVIEKNLKVMDMSAFSLCRQHKIKIVVFNFNKKGNILKAVSNESVGSLVYF
ncbi:MAG: UMP kinase [Elusimicrobia bacterium]|nr:UMP kinase [Elusimicrobiota bacterium]